MPQIHLPHKSGTGNSSIGIFIGIRHFHVEKTQGARIAPNPQRGALFRRDSSMVVKRRTQKTWMNTATGIWSRGGME